MKEQLQQRLEQLKNEYELGKKTLRELDEKQTNLRDTMLRIAGGIQVLEEEIAKAEETEINNDSQPPIESEIITNS